MSDTKCSCVFNQVGQLILDELKLIRRDMNIEIRKLKETVDNILISKIMLNYNPSFSKNYEAGLHNLDNIHLQLYGYNKNGLEDNCDNGQWPEVNTVLSLKDEDNVKGKDCFKEEENVNLVSNAADLDLKYFDDNSSSEQKPRDENNYVDISSIKKRSRKPFNKQFIPKDIWQCSVCGREFESRGGLATHFRQHTTKKASQDKTNKHNTIGIIVEVDSKVDDLSERNDKVNNVMEQKLKQEFTAEVVKVEKSDADVSKPQKTFPFNRKLQNFAQNSNGLYLCPYCKKEFLRKRIASRHLCSHIKPFRCPTCGKGFAKPTQLKQHRMLPSNCISHRVKKARQSNSKTFYCNLCSKSFFTDAKLELHISAHLGIKPYFCHLCNSTLKNAKGFKRHVMRAHKKY